MAAHSVPAIRGANFIPCPDIQSLKGKTILVTCANSGLGKLTALELARHHPAHIWMADDATAEVEATISAVKAQSPDASVSFLELDVTSLASVKSAAELVISSSDQLDLLFLISDVVMHEPAVTQDGYEIHFGANHLSHALLLKLLTPRLSNTAANGADVRVVSLTSSLQGYHVGSSIMFDMLWNADIEGLDRVHLFYQSKLANLLYAREVVERYPQFTTVSVDPGDVTTEMLELEYVDDDMRRSMTSSIPETVRSPCAELKNRLWMAIRCEGVTGEHIRASNSASGTTRNLKLQKKLWEWTEEKLIPYAL
ncbi:NAD(P)-binding protein [Xylariaceae sp. FL1651]|nr:NAD(P)-binding protein [Xylariaceae sp. FL1651]